MRTASATHRHYARGGPHCHIFRGADHQAANEERILAPFSIRAISRGQRQGPSRGSVDQGRGKVVMVVAVMGAPCSASGVCQGLFSSLFEEAVAANSRRLKRCGRRRWRGRPGSAAHSGSTSMASFPGPLRIIQGRSSSVRIALLSGSRRRGAPGRAKDRSGEEVFRGGPDKDDHPHSTASSRASCCTLLKRWISSMRGSSACRSRPALGSLLDRVAQLFNRGGIGLDKGAALRGDDRNQGRFPCRAGRKITERAVALDEAPQRLAAPRIESWPANSPAAGACAGQGPLGPDFFFPA